MNCRHTLLALYAYRPPLLLSSIDAILVVMLMIAAREQLRAPPDVEAAAFFSNGSRAWQYSQLHAVRCLRQRQHELSYRQDGASLLGQFRSRNSRKPQHRCSLDFYGTTTLLCPSLNPVVGRYGTNHKSTVSRYGTVVWIQWCDGVVPYQNLTLWYPSISPAVKRYATQPWIKRDVMATSPDLIHFRYQNVRLGHHNVTLGNTIIPEHRHTVWCKSYLDILNRLGA